MSDAIVHESPEGLDANNQQCCLRCGVILCDYSKSFAAHPPIEPNLGLPLWAPGPVTVDGNAYIMGIQPGATLCHAEG